MSEMSYGDDGSDDVIYDDDGTPLGVVLDGQDGDQLLVGFDGQILSGVDANAEPFDVSAEYPEYVPGAEPDPGAEFDERLAQLEERVEEPMPVTFERHYEPVSEAMLADDMRLQCDRLEQQIGRPLTLNEQRRLAETALQDVEQGDERPDFSFAAERLADAGEGLLNMDSGHRGKDHEARTRWMSERIQDTERFAAAGRGEDDLTEPQPPPSQDYYDMDDRNERLAYYGDRLRDSGVDASDTYASSDYAEGGE